MPVQARQSEACSEECDSTVDGSACHRDVLQLDHDSEPPCASALLKAHMCVTIITAMRMHTKRSATGS